MVKSIRMKAVYPLLIVSLLLLASGCKDNPVEQYGAGLMDAQKKAQETADAATLSALQTSIQSYRAVNGRYPLSLKEIEALANLKLDPAKYDYDPSTGEIKQR